MFHNKGIPNGIGAEIREGGGQNCTRQLRERAKENNTVYESAKILAF